MRLVWPLICVALLLGCESEELRPAKARDATAERARILFVGDTAFGESYQEEIAQAGGENILDTRGYDYPLQKLDSLLYQSDFVVANLETPVTNLPASPFDGEKGYIHWADVDLTPAALARHNITVVSLANNHTLDYGGEGFRQTLDALDAADIEWFGAGRNEAEASRPFRYDVSLGDRTVRIVVAGGFEYARYYDETLRFYASGDTAGVNNWTLASAAAQIRALRDTDADAFIVTFPHWGKNYRWKLRRQREMAQAMIDAGADLVLGHGAHMLQEIEQYRGRWIVYGLGNFMFNSPGRYREKNRDPFSLAARLDVSEDSGDPAFFLRLYPIFCENESTDYQPRLVSERELRTVQDLLLKWSPLPRQLRQMMTRGKDGIGWFFELDVTPGR